MACKPELLKTVPLFALLDDEERATKPVFGGTAYNGGYGFSRDPVWRDIIGHLKVDRIDFAQVDELEHVDITGVERCDAP